MNISQQRRPVMAAIVGEINGDKPSAKYSWRNGENENNRQKNGGMKVSKAVETALRRRSIWRKAMKAVA
jgi:hypothetical protein